LAFLAGSFRAVHNIELIIVRTLPVLILFTSMPSVHWHALDHFVQWHASPGLGSVHAIPDLVPWQASPWLCLLAILAFLTRITHKPFITLATHMIFMTLFPDEIHHCSCQATASKVLSFII
jgi:hypothetical protein